MENNGYVTLKIISTSHPKVLEICWYPQWCEEVRTGHNLCFKEKQDTSSL